MPSFFRVFRRDGAAKSKKASDADIFAAEPAPKWEEAWARKEVQPEEVDQLIHVCTQEMKSRALDTPFILLPFRPQTDILQAKTFIRQYFRLRYEGTRDTTAFAQRELRLLDPHILCSIMKWCWARLPGGVVTWETYDLFKAAETDSKMAKNAFDVFIPMSTESPARKEIICDFYDLLAAVAARGKTNGLGGRKLSRYAGWWAFQHSDDGKGFDGGYRSWSRGADACSHLFFAYLRALAPLADSGVSGISKLPRSLQALLSQTEYPPETPFMMHSTTTKVVMIVDSVSPTPFELLRRARNFEYRDDDQALQDFSNYEDPVQALTDECRRVLERISSVNESSTHTKGKNSQDPSWAMFEDQGFDSISESLQSTTGDLAVGHDRGIVDDLGRPTTPSWADFLSSGFPDDRRPGLLSPDKQLPLPLSVPRGHSSQSHVRNGAFANLEPGELASITRFDLDETFWWAWISSLAGEETIDRKAVFGRCALIETAYSGTQLLVIEEQIKGASPGQDEGVYIAEKKSRFSFSRRGKLSRKKTIAKKKEAAAAAAEPFNRDKTGTPASKIGPEQHAKLQQAAQQLAQGRQVKGVESSIQRRSRLDAESSKTNSMMTLGPTILTEAGPALKWTKHYDSGTVLDKDDVRHAYLNDRTAGTGRRLDGTRSASNLDLPTNGHATPAQRNLSTRDLPALPDESSVQRNGVSPPRTPPRTKSYDVASDMGTPTFPEEKRQPDHDKHPAFRPQDSPELVKPAPSPELHRTTTSSSDKHHPKKLQKNQAGGGGFKSLFSRKKSHQPDRTESAPAPTTAAPSQKKSPSRPLIVPVTQSAHPAVPDSPINSIRNEEPTFNEPVLEDPTPVTVSARDEARREALEKLEAEQEFSRFDQGPLDDVPAFVPVDESPEPSVAPPPIPIARKVVAPVEVSPPEAPVQSETPVSAIDDRSDDSNDAMPAPSYNTSDRWAQIRKNAAERAQRMNREQQHDRNHSQSNRSDEGETSGEETIESRVARIKARVAELTGNMENNAAPAGVR